MISEKIVHMRLILDRILPIEDKMKHQIEKMINVSATGRNDANDKTNYRANVADLEVISSQFISVILVVLV